MLLHPTPTKKTHRSTDGGASWKLEGAVQSQAGQPNCIYSETAQLSRLSNGTLLLLFQLTDRTEHSFDGIHNPATGGRMPSLFALRRSEDNGVTWSPPMRVSRPASSSSFGPPSPIVHLNDGRWAFVLSTWPNWSGQSQFKAKHIILFSSEDQGKTWSHAIITPLTQSHVDYNEPRLIVTQDGALLVTAWCQDIEHKSDIPNMFLISRDNGQSWSPPDSTCLLGQALELVQFASGKLLCGYRRVDVPGIWLHTATIADTNWTNGKVVPVWGSSKVPLVQCEDEVCVCVCVVLCWCCV